MHTKKREKVIDQIMNQSTEGESSPREHIIITQAYNHRKLNRQRLKILFLYYTHIILI